MHARPPGILPAVGALHGLLLHPHLQVRLPRAHGDAPHQGAPHAPHRTHHRKQRFACSVHVERHTHRRACMRRAAASPARTTHARNATRHALQRAAAIQPRALCGADQVCAPATIGAARGVLRRRRPAHGKRRVQCVRRLLRSCPQTPGELQWPSALVPQYFQRGLSPLFIEVPSCSASRS